jgi:hypothetical protein
VVVERVDPGAIPWVSAWWTAFDAFNSLAVSETAGIGRCRKAVDGFLAAINAVMPGSAIDRTDSPYLGTSNAEIAAVAAHEAEIRGVPIDTIKFLIAVHSSV